MVRGAKPVSHDSKAQASSVEIVTTPLGMSVYATYLDHPNVNAITETGIEASTYSPEQLRDYQSKDPDLELILVWDKTEPSEATIFRCSPIAKKYWINKDMFYLDDNGILRNLDKKDRTPRLVDNLSADFVMKDIVGKQMKAIKVFSSAIEYLKNHLLNSLQTRFKRGGNISNADIHWVLTVPAIWEMKAKQFMRDAAEMAGIKGDQLSLALEPEAASLYCQKVPMSIRENVTKTVDFLGPGTSYVVLDQGGGTFDVTGHQIEDDNFLKELFSPNGGSWGGNNVNHKFEKYLEEIFTVSVVDAVKQENPMAYFDAHLIRCRQQINKCQIQEFQNLNSM
ncbi:heat shock 70 kDa protein 12A-like [Mytilus californianus]|uniref:heat shock 70 kDa protein 12A-like n=1 Tax=Mytilus californianus TaxID=6549 RepID=UPI0022485487|nr:heat shock 70 kDa protein 12A-like [Mytilus californianus]